MSVRLVTEAQGEEEEEEEEEEEVFDEYDFIDHDRGDDVLEAAQRNRSITEEEEEENVQIVMTRAQVHAPPGKI